MAKRPTVLIVRLMGRGGKALHRSTVAMEKDRIEDQLVHGD